MKEQLLKVLVGTVVFGAIWFAMAVLVKILDLIRHATH